MYHKTPFLDDYQSPISPDQLDAINQEIEEFCFDLSQYVVINQWAYKKALSIAKHAGDLSLKAGRPLRDEISFMLTSQSMTSTQRYISIDDCILPKKQVNDPSLCTIPGHELTQLKHAYTIVGWGHSHGDHHNFFSSIDYNTRAHFLDSCAYGYKLQLDSIPAQVNIPCFASLVVNYAAEDPAISLSLKKPVFSLQNDKLQRSDRSVHVEHVPKKSKTDPTLLIQDSPKPYRENLEDEIISSVSYSNGDRLCDLVSSNPKPQPATCLPQNTYAHKLTRLLKGKSKTKKNKRIWTWAHRLKNLEHLLKIPQAHNSVYQNIKGWLKNRNYLKKTHPDILDRLITMLSKYSLPGHSYRAT